MARMAKKNQIDMILVLKTKNMNEQKCYSWMFSTNEVSSSKLYCYIVTTETLVRAVCDSRVISKWVRNKMRQTNKSTM